MTGTGGCADHISWGRLGREGSWEGGEGVGGEQMSELSGGSTWWVQGRKSEGAAVVCSKAERVMRAPHIESPALGLGLWVTWVPGDTELGFKKRFHKGHKQCLSWPRSE